MTAIKNIRISRATAYQKLLEFLRAADGEGGNWCTSIYMDDTCVERCTKRTDSIIGTCDALFKGNEVVATNFVTDETIHLYYHS